MARIGDVGHSNERVQASDNRCCELGLSWTVRELDQPSSPSNDEFQITVNPESNTKW